MDVETDVVVIGAGVIGSSVALELARSGRSVVCLDKGPGAGAGSTSSSSSIIRFTYSTRDAIYTAWEAAPMWHDWAGHLGVVDPDGMARFIPTGMIMFDAPDIQVDRITGLWDEIGIAYERLSPAEIKRRWPAFDVGRFYPPKRVDDPEFAGEPTGELGGIYEAQAGFMDDPMLCARNLAYAARHHGATFRFRSEVVEVLRADGRVAGVRLADGDTIGAPVVVNVGGPYSTRLNELAGVTGDMRIGHRPLRQEVFAVPAPAGLGLDDGGPLVSDLDVGQYFRPQVGGTLLVGGTEPACDELEWIDDPDTYNENTTVEHFETTVYRLARRVPDFGVPHRPVGLAALYDASDDWVPIYDKSSLPGWFMACGTSGNQFKNAPIAGQFMRALVDAADAGIDHDVDPVTFTGALTGQPIHLSSFSRRRDRASTSGTVMG